MTFDGLGPLLVVALGVSVVVCFLIGAMSPATWIARAFGKDVRQAGSGNPGATNAGRVLGVKWGVVVGILDVLKGLLPCLLLLRSMGWWFAAVGGVFLVLGHVFSPFLRGRGGKGVATTLGVLLAIAPWVALGAVVVFGLLVLTLKRIGEASIIVAVLLVIVGAVVALNLVEVGIPDVGGLVIVVIALIVLVRHRRNIIIAIGRRRAGR